jgi:hypothetical protein
MVRAIVFAATTAFALVGAPGYLQNNTRDAPVTKKHPASASLDVGNKSSRLFFVLPGGTSQTVHDIPPQTNAPFSCVQLQVIDESEFLSDPADCD